LYAQGRTLRQISAELDLSATTVSQQLRRAGITMRRSAPAHPTSTQQILELRDQGLTWNEVAKRVDMTVSGAWSRCRRTRPPTSPRLSRWQQVLSDALDKNLVIGVRAAVADHRGRAPGLNSMLFGEPSTVSPPSVVPACFTWQAPMPTIMQAIAPISSLLGQM
jgi:hypothetical protein